MKRLILILLAGCIRYAAPPDVRSSSEPPDRFPHAPGSGFVLTHVESNEKYETSILSFPAYDRTDPKNPIVRAELRRPKSCRGVILVLPILGGDYGASNIFAEHFAENGFATLRFDRREDIFDPEKDFAHVARSIKDSVIDVRRSLDWPPIKRLVAQGAGVMGISMGSFIATGVAATDRRIEASVLALGGADLVDIIYSARSEWEIGRFFDALEKRGWSDERIRREAHLHLDPIDPGRFAPAIDPRSTLLVHARFDDVVPYAYGTKLWKAAGKPRRITLMAGHYTAALYVPWLLQLTEEHFERLLH